MQVEFQTSGEKRHGEVLNRGDLAAARIAADDWIKACDALTEYVAAHPDLYRDTGGARAPAIGAIKRRRRSVRYRNH
jgi:hypothetical protein